MEEQDDTLIRTDRRDRLPSALSYPTSPTALSAALIGIPQFGALKLRFQAKPFLFASDSQRRLASALPLPAVQLTYWQHPIGMSAPRKVSPGDSLYREHWDL